jgi:hypothetical protein
LSTHATQVWPSRSSFVGRARSRRYVGHMGNPPPGRVFARTLTASSPDPANESMPVRGPGLLTDAAVDSLTQEVGMALWRAYSSIMWTRSSRRDTGLPAPSRPTKLRSVVTDELLGEAHFVVPCSPGFVDDRRSGTAPSKSSSQSGSWMLGPTKATYSSHSRGPFAFAVSGRQTGAKSQSPTRVSRLKHENAGRLGDLRRSKRRD